MKTSKELLQLIHRAFPCPAGKYHSLELEQGPDGQLSILIWVGPFERIGYIFSDEDFDKAPASLCCEIVKDVAQRRRKGEKLSP